jgi:ComF family protein
LSRAPVPRWLAIPERSLLSALSAALSTARSASFAACSAVARGLVDLLLPRRCAACAAAAPSGPLCLACRHALPAPPAAHAGSAPPLQPQLDELVAAAGYAGELERWIQAFKYPQRGVTGADPAAIAVVRALICEAARGVTAAAEPYVVIPVPLHPRRLRARGFNPSAVLARAVAREQRAQLETHLLVRCRDTPSQTGLDRRGRARNVAGAFRCTRVAPPAVLLVDDVVTTGATVAECARVLRRAGAERVVVVCVARTPI